MKRLSSIAFALLRVVSGLLFFHAGSKLFLGWFGGTHKPWTTELGFGGILEFFGGLLILLGLFTRPVAFILSGEMAVAYWQFHAPEGGWPIQNHGELAVLFCFIFFYMAAHGGGAYSVDALLQRKRGT